ncbi:hypothetical protein ElyMa_000794200 [Elysia marginata]|uniref:F-box domain-containing protein n=1 Tax=Elysia marginata TaxID=1093978 RepID=A0AAV4GY62_9GAST|nr:hypothetical protein ElyMa_000794200 [Elysia marginata]
MEKAQGRHGEQPCSSANNLSTTRQPSSTTRRLWRRIYTPMHSIAQQTYNRVTWKLQNFFSPRRITGLPPEVIVPIFKNLDAQQILELRPLHSVLYEASLQALPCFDPYAQHCFGMTFTEQNSHLSPQFKKYYENKRWMPILRKKALPEAILNHAEYCTIFRAAIIRKLALYPKELICTFNSPTYTTAIATLPHNPDKLVSAHIDGTINIWDLSKRSPLPDSPSFRAHDPEGRDNIQFIAPLSARHLLTGSCAEIKLWHLNDSENHECIKIFNEHNQFQNGDRAYGATTAMQLISSDGVRFVAGYDNNHVILWELNKPQTCYLALADWNNDCSIRHFSLLAPNSLAIIPYAKSEAVHIWDISLPTSPTIEPQTFCSEHHGIKHALLLWGQKLVFTSLRGDYYAVTERFPERGRQPLSWFPTLHNANKFHFEAHHSHTTSTASFDGQFISIGNDEINFWNIGITNQETYPEFSMPFLEEEKESSEADRKYALFSIQDGRLLVIALKKHIEVWDLAAARPDHQNTLEDQACDDSSLEGSTSSS